MNCYEYEIIHTSENPILKNVDLSIVLAMKGTNRFVRDPFILNLTKTTIIQWNIGFKKCKKHSSIKNTPHDLVHAYETALNYSKKYDNVIIFEDDAIVINKDLDIYKKIDKFIGNENFDRNDSILTFGSIASFKTYDNDFLKASGTKYGFSQATIFSRSSRNNLLSQFNIKGYSVGQPDQSYLSQLDNKFTYKYPLIVQTFPETENFDNWFFELPPVLAKLGRLHFKIFFKILNLHIKPDGWHFMYFMDSDIGRIIIKLIILLIILFFYNKTTIKLPLINI
jgi:hypothetical protein